MADSLLHEAVCRQRPYLWPIVCYMEAGCRKRTYLWPTVCSMKLCVDRDITCGR